MIKTEIFASVFKSHGIEKVLLVQAKNRNIFLIQEMSSSIPLNRWEHLENILKDICQSECDILSYDCASKYINIKNGVTIE